jgi:hypothetical protein
MLRRIVRRVPVATQATIAYRASTSTKGNTTTFSVTMPAGAQTGDLAVVWIGWNITSTTTTAPDPSGWDLISPPGQVDDEAQVGTRAWTRVVQASDPGSLAVSFTFAATVKAVLFLVVYSGAGDVRTAQAVPEGDTTTTSHVSPSFTADANGCWALQVVCDKAATSTTAWTAPGGTTVREQQYNTGSASQTGAFVDSNGPVANGAAVGGGTFASNGSATSRAVTWTLLIEPALTGPPSGQPVVYRAGATPVQGNTTSFSITIPITAVLNDTAVLAIGWGYNTSVPSIATPAGWTPLSIGQQTDENALATAVWTKTIAAGDPGRTITIGPLAATVKAVLLLEVWSSGGVAAATAAVEGAAATTSHLTAQISNSDPGNWLAQVVFDRQTATGTNTTVWTEPSDQTVRHDIYSTGTAAVTGVVSDSAAPVATGQVGGETFTTDGSGTSRAVGYSLLLSPGGGGAGNSNLGKAIFGMACTTAPPPNLPDGQLAGAGYSAGGDTSQNWRDTVDTYMSAIASKMHYHRGFAGNLSSGSCSGDAALSIGSALSVKTSIPTAATGATNSAFASFMAGFPDYTVFILHHEPENDAFAGSFTPEQWAAAQVHFANTAHTTNSTFRTYLSHLGYLWGYPQVGGKSAITSDPSRWVVPVGPDALCNDIYLQPFQTGYSNVFDYVSYDRWDKWARGILAGTGTGNPNGIPLGLTELGISRKKEDSSNGGSTWSYTYPYSDAQIATVMEATIVRGLSNGYRVFWWWNSYHSDFFLSGGVSTFWDHNLNETTTETTNKPGPLALAKWIDLVTQFGSTSPDVRDTV